MNHQQHSIKRLFRYFTVAVVIIKIISRVSVRKTPKHVVVVVVEIMCFLFLFGICCCGLNKKKLDFAIV